MKRLTHEQGSAFVLVVSYLCVASKPRIRDLAAPRSRRRNLAGGKPEAPPPESAINDDGTPAGCGRFEDRRYRRPSRARARVASVPVAAPSACHRLNSGAGFAAQRVDPFAGNTLLGHYHAELIVDTSVKMT